MQTPRERHGIAIFRGNKSKVKYRDLKCFKEEEEEEEVLMYSGIEFQIKVPEKLNKLQFKSVFGIGV